MTLTKREFVQKCFTELLSDGNPHDYKSLRAYIINQAIGTEFEGQLDSENLINSINPLLAASNQYLRIRRGIYQMRELQRSNSMFNITFTNPAGQSETVALNPKDFYPILKKFHEYNVDGNPYLYKIKNTKQDDALIKIDSDSTFGKCALKLLKDDDTLYTVYMLAEGLANVRDEIKDDIEQELLHGQYATTKELFDDIRETTIALNSHRTTFYCPLVGNIQNDADGLYEETDNATLLEHADEISDLLQKAQPPEVNMTKYVSERSDLQDKLVFVEWSVEELDGTLYGKIDCYLSAPLTETELERLRTTLNGQNSDGFGEGFEERAIYVDDGRLYVSFWNSTDDYFLRTEEEMQNAFDLNKNNQTMGGL